MNHNKPATKCDGDAMDAQTHSQALTPPATEQEERRQTVEREPQGKAGADDQ